MLMSNMLPLLLLLPLTLTLQLLLYFSCCSISVAVAKLILEDIQNFTIHESNFLGEIICQRVTEAEAVRPLDLK